MKITPQLKKTIVALAASGGLAIAYYFTPQQEGTRYTPYDDGGGTLTVCSGITGSDVIPGKTYTKQECDALFKKHMDAAGRSIDRLVHVPLNTFQRNAYADFVFHYGSGNFASSTLLKKLNARDYPGACNQLKRWVFQGKVKVEGLENRADFWSQVCRMGDK